VLIDSSASVDQGQTLNLNGAFISTGSGPWSGLVDYGDGTPVQTLALAADNTFHLAHAYRTAGDYQAVVRIRGGSGPEGSAGVRVEVVAHPLTRVLTAAASSGPRPGDAIVILSFSGALDALEAENISIYTLVSPGRDRRLGTRDDVALKIASAAYDRALHAVTLRPSGRLSSLALRSTGIRISDGALHDAFGVALDGDGDVSPGGVYLAGVSGPARAPARFPGRLRVGAANVLGWKPLVRILPRATRR
jgi:hypothetical protein